MGLMLRMLSVPSQLFFFTTSWLIDSTNKKFAPHHYSNILEQIGDHFLDHAVVLVKAGRKFVLVCDNIDLEERVHDM